MSTTPRSRSPPRDSNAAATRSSSSELGAFSGGSTGINQNEFNEFFKTAMETNKNSLLSSIEKPIVKIVQDVSQAAYSALDTRLFHVEGSLTTLEEKLDTMAQEQKEFQKEVLSQLAVRTRPMSESKPSGNALFSSPPLAPPTPPSHSAFSDGSGVGIPLTSGGGFFRALDPTVLFANTKDFVKVSRVAFSKSFLSLSQEVNVDSDCIDISGDDLGAKFTIRFKGTDPARSAKTVFQSLFLGKGEWKEQVVDSPNGQIQFFVSPDKNGAQVRKEVLAKKLCTFLQSCTEENVKCVRVTGHILVGKKRLAALSIKDEFNFEITWDPALAGHLKLDTAKVSSDFRSKVELSL